MYITDTVSHTSLDITNCEKNELTHVAASLGWELDWGNHPMCCIKKRAVCPTIHRVCRYALVHGIRWEIASCSNRFPGFNTHVRIQRKDIAARHLCQRVKVQNKCTISHKQNIQNGELIKQRQHLQGFLSRKYGANQRLVWCRTDCMVLNKKHVQSCRQMAVYIYIYIICTCVCMFCFVMLCYVMFCAYVRIHVYIYIYTLYTATCTIATNSRSLKLPNSILECVYYVYWWCCWQELFNFRAFFWNMPCQWSFTRRCVKAKKLEDDFLMKRPVTPDHLSSSGFNFAIVCKVIGFLFTTYGWVKNIQNLHFSNLAQLWKITICDDYKRLFSISMLNYQGDSFGDDHP